MSKYMTHSKATQMSAMQQGHKVVHSGPLATAMPTHKDIAKRAYEIYVEKNCQQGQSELNWLQAEQELRNQENWLQAEQE
jgi:hypothetical protein